MPFASTDLAARVEGADSRLVEASATAILRRRPGADIFVEPLAGGVATATVDGSPFNKVAGIGFGGRLDAGALGRMESAFFERGLSVRAEVSTLADPSVFRTLSARGYRLEAFENVLGLWLADRPKSLTPSKRVAVRRTEPDEVPTWLETVATGFETPDEQGVQSTEEFPRDALLEVLGDMASVDGFFSYLAFAEGAIAGGAGLRLDADGVAQLCGAATLPTARRRGVQTALLDRRLADAGARGCDLATVTTQPGSTSCQNVHKWGFELLYVRAVMVLDPPSHAI